MVVNLHLLRDDEALAVLGEDLVEGGEELGLSRSQVLAEQAIVDFAKVGRHEMVDPANLSEFVCAIAEVLGEQLLVFI